MGQSFAKLVASQLADARAIGPTPKNRFEAWAFIREAIDEVWEAVKYHNYAGTRGGAAGQDAELLGHLIDVAVHAARFALDIEVIRGWTADIAAAAAARKLGTKDFGKLPMASAYEAYARLHFASAELAAAINERLVATGEVKLRELAVLAQLAAEDLGLVADEPEPEAKTKAKANGKR